MRTGKCTKCGSTEVYVRRNGLMAESMPASVTTSTFGAAFALDCYLCLDCQYVELYAAETSNALIGQGKSLTKAILNSKNWKHV